MVVVENLNSEAVSFDSQSFGFESLHSEVGNWKIAAEKKEFELCCGKF